MTVASKRNSGALIKAVPAFDPTTVTAGGALDNVLQAGIVLDRNDFSAVALSAKLAVILKTFSLGPATATFTPLVKDSADGVTFAAFGSAVAAVVKNTDGTYVEEVDFQIGGARRFLRIDWTCDLSAGSVDTCTVAGVLILGGFAEVPAPVVAAAGVSA